MEQGWDPELKKYFRRIIKSLSAGLLWLLSCVTLGLYFKLAYRQDISVAWIILFYAYFLLTLVLLLRFLYRVWQK